MRPHTFTTPNERLEYQNVLLQIVPLVASFNARSRLKGFFFLCSIIIYLWDNLVLLDYDIMAYVRYVVPVNP